MKILLASLAFALAAPQPPSPPQPASPGLPRALVPEPMPVPVEKVLEEIYSAYQSAPTADRIQVSVREGSKPVRRDDIILRMNPIKTEDGEKDVEVSIDAGQLRVWAGGGMLVAMHVSRPETFYRHDYDPPLTIAKLDAILRPTPLPQLAFATASKPGNPITLYYLAPTTRWSAGKAVGEGEKPYASAEGRSDSGPVVLVSDVKSGRLKSATFTIAAQNITLDLVVAPQPAGDPSKWMPSLAGRRLVASLPDLLRTDGPITVGQRLSNVFPMNVSGDRVKLEDLFPKDAAPPAPPSLPPPSDPAPPTPRRLALLLVRAPSDDEAPDPVAKAVQSALAKVLPQQYTLRTQLVFDAGSAITDAQKKTASQACAAWGDNTLWSTPRSATLGRIVPESDVVLLVLDPALIVTNILAFSEAGDGLEERLIRELSIEGP